MVTSSAQLSRSRRVHPSETEAYTEVAEGGILILELKLLSILILIKIKHE